MTRAPILDRAWPYIPAAAHGDLSGFAARQTARIKAAQQTKPVNVSPIILKERRPK